VALPRRDPARPGRHPGLLGGALWRIAWITTALSALLVAVSLWLGADPADTSLLLGFGLVAVATLLVSFLESVGRARAALGAVLAALAGLAADRLLGDGSTVAGEGLIVAALAACAVALPAALALLRRPATMLATTLWIP
jgi:hypothetical protein